MTKDNIPKPSENISTDSQLDISAKADIKAQVEKSLATSLETILPEKSVAPSFDSDAFLNAVTQQPGVYRMYNNEQIVIYVGKAKQLKKRLASYFRKEVGSVKTKVLVSQICAIDVTVTHTEGEALILENNYIKKYQPKYNILLRDDKSYPYLLISAHKHPKLGLYRGGKRLKGDYFGPFPSVGSVWESLRLLQKIFPIRQCEDSYYRARSRPCLQYQLGRCSAPCVGKISDEDYAQQVNMSKLFLKGKSSTVIESLVDKMTQASNSLMFEKAGVYRDQITTLRKVQQQQFVSGVAAEMDIIGLFRIKSQACIHLLNIRDHKVLGSKSFFPVIPKETLDEDILQAFIAQHYLSQYYISNDQVSEGNTADVEHNTHIPKEIVVASQLPEAEMFSKQLAKQALHEVKISSNGRTERKQYLKLATTNAETALMSKNAHKESIQARFSALNKVFELSQGIHRIECFDISHTMGQQTVASNVVFNQEGPLKRDYRRYNVYGITPGDDYAAMAFALKKRYGKVKDEENMPDIVFIDGGKGQLAQAEKLFGELNLNKSPLLVGVAKGESRKPGLETLILGGSHQLISLPATSPALHLIQHIRDESHRFAIAGHRAKRQKEAKKSVLESIEGVGAKKRQALLTFLGGIQEVKSAEVTELLKVPGISIALAEKIYDALHDK